MTPSPQTSPTRAGRQPRSPLVPPVLALEQARALDPMLAPAVAAGDRLAGAITADDRVRGLLQGRWLGHALHPLLIQLPLGTWMSALVLDLVGGDRDRAAAQRLVGVGLATAVPAALTGWSEYAALPPGPEAVRDKRVAVVHAGANALAAGLQLGSWVARRAGRHGLGRRLGVGAMSVAGAAGYLGGHLSVARKVGTRDPAFGADAVAAQV